MHKEHENTLINVSEKTQQQLNALANASVRMAMISSATDVIQQADNRLQNGGELDSFYKEILSEVMEVTAARYGAFVVFDIEGSPCGSVAHEISAGLVGGLVEFSVSKGMFGAEPNEISAIRVDNMAEE
ncbi:MAG: hypothetical protein KAR30_05900, partial [Gammaproteobacteria bacterium]|nr:hypothetical protein [Gammaproteobacteria bacterium]